MIIDKSLLDHKQNDSNNIMENFDFIQYMYELFSQSMINTNLLLIQESEDNTESAGIIGTIANIIKKIIGGIIKIIGSIFNAIMDFFKGFFRGLEGFDVELKRNEDKIKKVKKIIVKEGYKFTNLDEKNFYKYPSKNIVDDLISETNKTIEDMNQLFKSHKSFNEAKEVLLQIKVKYSDEKKVKNGFRKRILGDNIQSEKITDEEYKQKCYQVFRNNQSEKDKIEYTDVYQELYLPYINRKDRMNMIEKDHKNIEKVFEDSSYKVNNLKIYNINKYSPEEQKELKSLTQELQKILCVSYQNTCKDLVIMYSNKLQAYKDFMVQAKSLLKLGIKIVNNGKESNEDND